MLTLATKVEVTITHKCCRPRCEVLVPIEETFCFAHAKKKPSFTSVLTTALNVISVVIVVVTLVLCVLDAFFTGTEVPWL